MGELVIALLELTVWFWAVAEKPKRSAPTPPPPDDWTPPSTEEIARAVGWPNVTPAAADPLWDRQLDG